MTAAEMNPTASSGAADPAPRRRALTARLGRQLIDAQRTADELLAALPGDRLWNADEVELLLAGPALLVDMIKDDIEDALYRVRHSPHWGNELAVARVIANQPDRPLKVAA